MKPRLRGSKENSYGENHEMAVLHILWAIGCYGSEPILIADSRAGRPVNDPIIRTALVRHHQGSNANRQREQGGGKGDSRNEDVGWLPCNCRNQFRESSGCQFGKVRQERGGRFIPHIRPADTADWGDESNNQQGSSFHAPRLGKRSGI